MTIALFIGRFQPFHKGHLEVVKRFKDYFTQIKIAIGSSQEYHTSQNPFTYDERVEMITRTLKEEGIENYSIFGVPDIYDNDRWVAHTVAIVGNIDVVITGNELTQKLFEKDEYYVEFLEQRYFGVIAQEIRRKIIANEDWKGLVHPVVYDYLKEISGDERIQVIHDEEI